MKISSLVLILPLGLLSGQALAFYQQPMALNEQQARPPASADVFHPVYSKTLIAKMASYGLVATPAPECNCPFCTLLRQAG